MTCFQSDSIKRSLVVITLLAGCGCGAKLGVEYQMQLGNPSGARPDPSNHEHYLIQRSVFAMDYDDHNGEPNWVSWDLTAGDMGPATRASHFHIDQELPAAFHHIKSADYKHSSFDRGHMCPSADRTDTVADNNEVFAMSNIIPQTPDNNEGVWEKLEADCRSWAKAGNEVLIICGPAGFNAGRINGNGPVAVPSRTWKIVLVVPEGPQPLANRIIHSSRAIAVDIPNVAGVRNDPWTKYRVSVEHLEILTGYKFFTGLALPMAGRLKARIDGEIASGLANARTAPALFHAAQKPVPFQWIGVIITMLALILLLIIGLLTALFYTRPKR